MGGKLLRKGAEGFPGPRKPRENSCWKQSQGRFRPPGGRWGMRNWLDFGGYQTCRIEGAVLAKTGKCRDVTEVKK